MGFLSGLGTVLSSFAGGALDNIFGASDEDMNEFYQKQQAANNQMMLSLAEQQSKMMTNVMIVGGGLIGSFIALKAFKVL